MPLSRRVPKRGFTNIFRKDHKAVNLSRLSKIDKDEITLKDMMEAGIIKNETDEVKILGQGDMAAAKTVHAHRFSQSAQKKIEAAGGEIKVIGSE